ncbi:MAG: hypothetical protein K6E78_07390, partial [Treponema sp.]|nr:hypothetical protein [Treponema sp.]
YDADSYMGRSRQGQSAYLFSTKTEYKKRRSGSVYSKLKKSRHLGQKELTGPQGEGSLIFVVAGTRFFGFHKKFLVFIFKQLKCLCPWLLILEAYFIRFPLIFFMLTFSL